MTIRLRSALLPILVLSGVVGGQAGFAAIIAQEDFESYSASSALDTQNGGTGWTAGWVVDATTTPGAVVTTETGVMPGLGNSMQLTNVRAQRNVVERQFNPISDDVAYVGLSLRTNSNWDVTDFVQFYFNNTTGGTTGSDDSGISAGILNNTNAVSTPSAYFVRKGGSNSGSYNLPSSSTGVANFLHPNDSTVSLVFKISKSISGSTEFYDELALFVDQATEGAADAARSATDAVGGSASRVSTMSFFHVRFHQSTLDVNDFTPDFVYLDNLVVATTYAEALGAAVAVPGDFDGDGDVDGADFVVWQTNFPTAEGGTLDTGDADGDGDVDGADFVVWQTNFPTTPGGGVAAVPEPNAAISLLLGCLGLGWFCRNRQNRTLH